MRRVFLTGATGLVGGALLHRLLDRGDDVVALARTGDGAAALAEQGAEPVRGDIRDEAVLRRAMAGAEVAFHVAGVNTHCPSDPGTLLDVNVRGARTAVRAAAAAGVPRMVYTSSAASLGEAPGTVGHEDTPHRGWYLTVYERSKLQGERAVFDEAARTGVEAVAVNPSSVQGPGRAGGTAGLLIALLDGRLPAFIDTHLSIVDIGDCADGHLLAAEHGAPGARYVLNGATITTRDALAIVGRLSGGTDRVRIVPHPVVRTAAEVVERGFKLAGKSPPFCRGKVRTILHGHRYDGSRATRDLGLAYTPIDETIRRTARWAVDEGLVRRPLPGLAAATVREVARTGHA